MQLFKTKPHYEYLHRKWKKRHEEKTQNLFDKHLKNVAMSGLGGLMLLTAAPGVSPSTILLDQHPTEQPLDQGNDNNKELANRLKSVVPEDTRALTDSENQEIEGIIKDNLEIPVHTEMEGIRLNRTYGMMGGEQHLYRYPGDNVYAHARTASDWAMYGPSGIAPGLGAYGYFAPSKSQMTPLDEDRERYYIAVQTFLSPGFAENTKRYNEFFKFRKMLTINPKTGQAVVVVIGDAGPGSSTGKHLGGSPEVMHFLGIAKGPRKGAILYYFIDDPENRIPLGPVSPKGKI